MRHISIVLSLAAMAVPFFCSAADSAPAEDTAKKNVNVTVSEATNQVSAIVDGTIKIMKSDVDRLLKAVARPGMPDQTSNPDMRKRAIDQLVIEKLLLREANKGGITLSDEEFKAKMTEMPPLDQIAKMTGLSVADIEAQLRDAALIDKMLRAMADNVQEPTEEEVKNEFDKLAKQYPDFLVIPEEVSARHILLTVDKSASDDEKAKAKEKLEKIRKQILDGADFAKLAEESSDCPSGKRSGGDLGSFGRGSMVKEFEDVAFSSETGKVSQVFLTQFGYHILEVTGKQAAGTRTFESTKDDLSKMIQVRRSQEKVNSFMRSVHDAAKIEIIEKFETDEIPDVEKAPTDDVDKKGKKPRELPSWAK